jgi:hypothetical protein
MSPEAAAGALEQAIENEILRIHMKVVDAGPRACNALRNAELEVLNNASVSPPGTPPGVRTGDLRRNWTQFYGGDVIGMESGMNYAGYLEKGTRKMAARPFVDKIGEKAKPKILQIYKSIL